MIFFETNHPEEEDYVYHEYLTDFNFNLHFHSHFEIIYVSEGELNVRIDNNDFIIPKGNICLILPLQAHSFNTITHSICQVCVFSSTFAPDFYEKYRRKSAENPILCFESNANILDIISDKKTNRYMLASCFYFIISLFVNNTVFTDHNEKLLSFVKISIDYLDNNFDKEPKLCELAQKLNYDSHYCSFLFNKTFGKNFMSMINDYRIAKAQMMLKTGDLNITEVALICGYSCIRSFNRNYLKIVGVPPKCFKKQGGM